jgi:hypothetical protein
MSLKKFAFAVLMSLSAFAAHAKAPVITIAGGSLEVAKTGHVFATFLGSDASYTNILYFNGKKIFNGQTTTVGKYVDLGKFTQGTALTFQIFVKNTKATFSSGLASLNADNLFHANAVLGSHHSATLGFEDTLGGGDKDFNDLKFSITNVVAYNAIPAVPEPSSYAMLLGGLGLFGFLARRRQKSNQFGM